MVEPKSTLVCRVVVVALLLFLIGGLAYGWGVAGSLSMRKGLHLNPGDSLDRTVWTILGGSYDMVVVVHLTQGSEIASLVDAGPEGEARYFVPQAGRVGVPLHIEIPEEGYELEYIIKAELGEVVEGAGGGIGIGVAYGMGFPVDINPTPPVAVDDSYTVTEGSVLEVGPPGVLANDYDEGGDVLQTRKVPGSGPWHGEGSISRDGSFYYVPNPGFIGTDTLSYKAYDGFTEGNIGTVTFTVRPPNDPPVADAGPDQTVEQTSPAGADVTLDASASSDPDDDPLTCTWLEGDTIIAGPTTDLQSVVALSPGSHAITLIVEDPSGETDTDEVAVVVQDTTPPTIDPIADVTVDESHPAGTSVTFDEPTVSDNCDPDVEVTLAPVSGSLFLLGDTVVSCTAVDDCGNTATVTFTVQVVPGSPENQLDNAEELILDCVTSGLIEPELETSLLAKVNAALDALARDNPNAAKVAMNDLKALINQVEAQTDKKIDADVAAEMIERINRIVTDLGG